MEWSPQVLKFAHAISVAEGFGPPGNLPTRANNPGDLTGIDKGSFATNGTANKEGVWNFVNLVDGWSALYLKVDRILRGASKVYPLTMTLEEMGTRYAGVGKPEWAINVAKDLGVPVTMTLQQFISQEHWGSTVTA